MCFSYIVLIPYFFFDDTLFWYLIVQFYFEDIIIARNFFQVIRKRGLLCNKFCSILLLRHLNTIKVYSLYKIDVIIRHHIILIKVCLIRIVCSNILLVYMLFNSTHHYNYKLIISYFRLWNIDKPFFVFMV